MGVEKFYCCGKLSSVTLSIGSTESAQNTKKDDRCCRHEKQNLKVKDSHYASAKVLTHEPLPVVIPIAFNVLPVSIISTLQEFSSYRANAPPDTQQKPLYCLYHSYRI